MKNIKKFLLVVSNILTAISLIFAIVMFIADNKYAVDGVLFFYIALILFIPQLIIIGKRNKEKQKNVPTHQRTEEFYKSADLLYPPKLKKDYLTKITNTKNEVSKTAHNLRQALTNREIIPPIRTWAEPVALSFMDNKTKEHCNDSYTAYFKNGCLVDVNPRNSNITLDEDRQTAYDARYIVSDGITYDLENPQDIQSIQIPQFDDINGMPFVTRDLAYILKMRACAETRYKIAVPLAYKTANLMIASPMLWTKRDYFGLVAQLWSIGEFSYGDHLYEELKKRLPFVATENELSYYKKTTQDVLYSAYQLGDDYIISRDTVCPCAKCAIYRNRIYNISGKDARFPKFSDYISDSIDLCCIDLFSTNYPWHTLTVASQVYEQKTIKYIGHEVDAIKHSNRPFIDDRAEWEKENYIESCKRKEQQENADKLYYSRDQWIKKYYCYLEYQEIVTKLNIKTPKSYSGYKRMKAMNTANYQKLAALARENGIKIQ